jgi:N-acetylglutamate synthase-like GNAT family acetyltransferase
MRIRKARIADSAEIARLHRGTIRTVNKQDYPQEDIEAWSKRSTASRFRNSHHKVQRYVAVEDGKIIGFVDIDREDPEELGGLYIHRKFIGKGVGSKLLKAMESMAKKQGAKRLHLQSTLTAIPFYQKKGFKLLRKSKHTINNRTLDIAIMEKKL